MEQSKFLRVLLFVHFLIAIITGIELLFMREMLGEIVATNFEDQGWLVLGAAYVGLGVMFLVAFHMKTWEGAKAVVIGEIFFLASALLALYLWHSETYELSTFLMVEDVVGAVFLVGFIFAYLTHRNK